MIEKSLLGLGVVSGMAMAAPVNPIPFTVENQGDSVTLQRGGDEHYRFTKTVDGFLVVKGENDVYFYADEDGKPSKFVARNDAKRSAQEKAFLRKLDKDKSYKSHRKSHPDRLVRPKEHQAPKRAPWVPTEESSGSSEGDGVHPLLRLPKAESHANGTNSFPIILVTTSGGKSYLDSASFTQMLNKAGYNSNGYTGSVRDYFTDQSSNRFVPTFDVYTVSVNNNLSSYASDDYKLVVDAVNAVKSKYSGFDASKYDKDNDGTVDVVGVFYSGTDDSDVGGYHYALQWNGVTNFSVGGRKFNSYFLLSQGTYPFVSMIHEFSHSLGLADHYCVYSSGCYNDYTNSSDQSPGAHAWDVMATGMYNNGGKTPPNYSAFERNFMGWLDYATLESSSDVALMESLDKSNFAYKVPVAGTNDEWFILENRQQNKWDSKLPYHGMLIWHIDYNQRAWDDDSMNDDPAHQRVDVVEAGNLKVNDYYDGQSATHLKDDPFPGSQNVTSFGPFKSWAGVSQNIQLYSITEKNGNVCFATQNGVAVNDCAVLSSSSAVLSSSSAMVESSSAAAKSSSSVSKEEISSSSQTSRFEQSSSSTESILSQHEAIVRVSVNGGNLLLNMPMAGTKTVKLFDMQGNLLVNETIYGTSASVRLQGVLSTGSFIVRVVGGSKVLAVQKITIR